MYFHSSNFRHEPKGLSLVFLSRESIFKNDKSTVLPQFKTFGSVERRRDYRYAPSTHSGAGWTGVKRIIDLGNVSFCAHSNERFRKKAEIWKKKISLNIGIGNQGEFIVCTWASANLVEIKCHFEVSPWGITFNLSGYFRKFTVIGC